MGIKYFEFNAEKDKIEFYNSILGVEKVFVNGKVVSTKLSLFGSEHQFKIDNDTFNLKSKSKFFGDRVIYFTLNKKIIESRIVQFEKKQRLFWVFLGALIGFGLVRLIEYLY